MNTADYKNLHGGFGSNRVAVEQINTVTPVTIPEYDLSKSVTVASDEVLRCVSHSRYMGAYFMSKGLSRYDVVDWVNHQICEYLWKERKVYWPDGREFVYRPGALDDAFRNDPSFRLIDEWFDRISDGGPWQKTSEPSLGWHRLFRIAATIVSPKQVQTWDAEK